jgi:uncharacterized protein (TIGR02646 family)
MIRLVRGAEPEALRDKRPSKLAEVRARRTAGDVVKLTGYGDDGVKDRLFEAQHGKCAYCEKREEQPKWRDAEHYRPKSHYWWLAWTWENLLFACIECNREYKGDQFPLVDEMTRLSPEAMPPGDESPLLIDPYAPGSDPRVEVVFRCERIQGRERWTPYGVTHRGLETVRLCGLDRPGLIELYNKHVRDFVRPAIDHFVAVAKSEDARVIVDAWSRLRRRLDAPGQAFRALSRDAAETLTPQYVRTQYRLTL